LKDIREALVKAVNVQEIVDVVLLGAATPGGTGFVHPKLDSYSKNANVIKFNLTEAAAILDGLKFIDRDGDGVRETDTGKKLDFSIITQSTNPTRIRCAELIKEWYGKIGIKIRIEAVDMSLVVAKVWPEYDARKGRDFDMTIFGWGASSMNSVSRYIALWHSNLDKGQSNLKAYKNPQMDAVLDKLAVETNLNNVKTLIMQMQDILSRDYAEVMLFYPDLVFAYNKAVHSDWTFLKGTGIINHLSLTNEAVPAATKK
jgi:peptide/nickel transport system substrate-binding protein